ncbi:hypothetical protein P7C70_g725, partial [Phenoliferia sp. Uapishka_3]
MSFNRPLPLSTPGAFFESGEPIKTLEASGSGLSTFTYPTPPRSASEESLPATRKPSLDMSQRRSADRARSPSIAVPTESDLEAPSLPSHTAFPPPPPLDYFTGSFHAPSAGPNDVERGQARERTDGSASELSAEVDTVAAANGEDSNMSTTTATTSPGGTPIKRFDPFAPLSPTRTTFPFAAPPATTSTTSNTNPNRFYPPPAPRPRSTSPSQAEKKSPFLQSSLVRENRPSSLYLPLDENPPRPDASGMTPTWPFSKENPSINYNNPPEPVPTPSAIHPSYAERPSSPPAKRLSPRLLQATLPGDDEKSAIRRSSPSAAPADRQWSAITVGDPDHRAGSSTPHLEGSAAAQLKFESTPSARHTPSFSVGTHHLLSSRASPSSKLARQLDTPTAWLILYFSFNLGLTLFNKLVLQGFPFPWTLTGIQMLSGTIGTQVALNRGFFTQARLTTREGVIMVAFSTLYTINIAVSNLSLHLVTVPFHQCVRALTPLATVVLSVMFLHKRPSRDTYLSLLPVVLGVVFATFGEYNYTMRGLILTLLGMFLAAVKTIVTNRVQVGRLKLHPLDLLIRMSPLAFMQCVLWGWYSGELDRVRIYGATEMTRSKAIALLVNGVIAFGLNVVSFTANKKTSALTMTVAANVKQVLTIVLAVIIFHIKLNATNMFGITLTLAGGAWYAKVELTEKSRQTSLSNSRMLDGVTDKRSPN